MVTSKEPLSDMEIIEGKEETEKAEGLHRVINPREAARRVQMLDETLNNMDTRIKSGKVKDIIKDAITQFKDIISRIVPQVAEADITKVMHSISDPMCLALRPRTEEREEMLEANGIYCENCSRI